MSQWRSIRVPKKPLSPPRAVIFLHSATAGRESFAREAQSFVDDGYVVLLIEAPYSRKRVSARPRGLKDPIEERGLWNRSCEDLSAAVVALETRYSIPPKRVALVGRNLGGSVGAYWIAEHRPGIGAFVATGAIPRLTEFWLSSDHPVAVRARSERGLKATLYLKTMRSLDLEASLARIEGTKTLVQFGSQDDWIESRAVAAFRQRAGSRITIREYADGHDMDGDATLSDRRAWISALASISNERINLDLIRAVGLGRT